MPEVCRLEIQQNEQKLKREESKTMSDIRYQISNSHVPTFFQHNPYFILHAYIFDILCGGTTRVQAVFTLFSGMVYHWIRDIKIRLGFGREEKKYRPRNMATSSSPTFLAVYTAKRKIESSACCQSVAFLREKRTFWLKACAQC